MSFIRSLSLASALVLLTFFPLSHAGTHIHSSHNHLTKVIRRRALTTHPLPGNWASQGCYSDNTGSRTLSGSTFASGDTMTVESCLAYCDTKSFVYAGVEWGQECYCGNAIGNGGTNTTATECDTPCSGNHNETCGSGGRLNLYWSGKEPPPPPVIVPAVGNWTSLGCYSEGTGGRTLPLGVPVSGPLTVELCTSACFSAGYPLAGNEYGAECYCGTTFLNSGAPAPASGCNMLCAGNSSEFCGGPGTLTAYNYTGTDLPPITAPPPAGGGGGAPVFTVASGLPGSWNYSGCYVDNAYGRVFEKTLDVNVNMTVESCVSSCAALNYTVAGAEYHQECYCGDRLVNGAVIAPENDCNLGCGGNATEACGGGGRLSVYSSVANFTVLPLPVVKTTNLTGNWTYAGCLREPGAVRVLPYQNVWPTNNTIDGCLARCAAFGFPAAGLEYAEECWCGDAKDVQANGGIMGDDAECTMSCSGDPLHLCGGPQRLQLYNWTGSMNTWHTPENTGRYEFFMPGPFVPLIATLGINDKVTFLEKGGTGIGNATSGYELDLTLTSNNSLAWREMNVLTDVFCAASLILPDKAGRQINIGGWSFDSTFGLRLYTPSGSAGVNGTTDWEENPTELHLQRGRWYPTALILANSSILVMGGETGSNAPAQPNLEILPKPVGGDTVVELEWLQRTDPNNLYPFLSVLPSGNVFVAYYNEARILDKTTFATVLELPNMPAAVNDFLGGRTYPLEGSAMSLPQYAPYTDPLTILICGGSAGAAGNVLDNCVSIAPEAPNATWTLERMPSKRVMPCMVALPDGTFMIMNGARQGYAGFGLAANPNLSAVLYDPSQPIGQRFSILNSTIVARMYHSEAILLNDGRVLISGSDPESNPDFPNFYPQEYRMEVYYPPYLTDGRTRPEFNVTGGKDWAYGSQNVVSVTLKHGTMATMRVSLIAASSSTHGNTMGGRTIFPAFTCADETTCTITAPPNANVSPPGWHMLFVLDGPTPSHSQWVRIGGDPAHLGEWPAVEGFAPPGM